MAPRLPLETVARIVDLARAGHTCDQIAELTGRHRASIRSKLVALGVPFKQLTKQLWTEDEISTAVAMRASGATFEDISKAIGRSAAAAREKLTTVGLHEPEVTRLIDIDPRPSPELLAARAYRYEMAARRTLSEMLLGDPPPGFSALDEKRRASGL